MQYWKLRARTTTRIEMFPSKSLGEFLKLYYIIRGMQYWKLRARTTTRIEMFPSKSLGELTLPLLPLLHFSPLLLLCLFLRSTLVLVTNLRDMLRKREMEKRNVKGEIILSLKEER